MINRGENTNIGKAGGTPKGQEGYIRDDGKVLTKFANNTYQYALPGQTEVLNMQSIQIVEEL